MAGWSVIELRSLRKQQIRAKRTTQGSKCKLHVASLRVACIEVPKNQSRTYPFVASSNKTYCTCVDENLITLLYYCCCCCFCYIMIRLLLQVNYANTSINQLTIILFFFFFLFIPFNFILWPTCIASSKTQKRKTKNIHLQSKHNFVSERANVCVLVCMWFVWLI